MLQGRIQGEGKGGTCPPPPDFEGQLPTHPPRGKEKREVKKGGKEKRMKDIFRHFIIFFLGGGEKQVSATLCVPYG